MTESSYEQSADLASDMIASSRHHDHAVSTLTGTPESDGGYMTPAGATHMDPSLLFARLTRHKWLILCLFVLVAVPSAVAIWTLLRPLYGSTALVRVSPVVSRVVFKTEDNGIVPLYRSYLNTQVSIICSPPVLQRVLDKPDIQRTRWYKEGNEPFLGSPLRPIERLTEALSVRPRRDTELIDVSMTALCPDEAKLVVDTVVDEYKKLVDETLRADDTQVLETLRGEYTALKKEIEGLIETKYNLSKRIGTLDSVELRSQLSTQLSALEGEHAELRRELSMVQWYLDQLPEQAGQQAESAPAEDLSQKRNYFQDGEWRRFNVEMQRLTNELSVARGEYGEQHPTIRKLEAAVAQSEQLLREREAQLDQQWEQELPLGTSVPSPGEEGAIALQSRDTLQRILPGKEREAKLLEEQINRQRVEVANVSDIAQQIAHYEEQIKQKRELYEAVRGRLQVLEMEGKAPARIRIESYGLEEASPVKDRRLMLTIMAVLGASVMALGAGYLRSRTDPKIHGWVEVRDAVQVPFLGQLPHLSAEQLPVELGGSAGTLIETPAATSEVVLATDRAGTATDASWLLMESVRVVRTALMERIHATGNRVVLVTSAQAHSGKTSVALLLAKSLSLMGKKVLLVEADLRRPSLTGRLGIQSSAGLPALLAGEITDAEAVKRIDGARFDVCPVGECPADFDPELLANGVFSACLRRWREKYDFVLLDSPPVLPVADARILAGHVDGTIMVLKSLHDRRVDVIETYARLSLAGGALLGTILIGGHERGGHYGYGYNYSYSYQYSSRGGTEGKRGE